MEDFRIRKRSRLKNKDARAVHDELVTVFGGLDLWDEGSAIETGSLPEADVIIVDNVIHGLRLEGQPFLSVRGLLAYKPTTRFVTVDMGAVRFVHNGADVMAPGIVDADPQLAIGDWCWIRDERNKQPLAVGICMQTGPEMVADRKGKSVRSIHRLGDRIWDLDG